GGPPGPAAAPSSRLHLRSAEPVTCRNVRSRAGRRRPRTFGTERGEAGGRAGRSPAPPPRPGYDARGRPGSAAAAGGAAALADVAAAGRAHLRAAGQAERRVGGTALVAL